MKKVPTFLMFALALFACSPAPSEGASEEPTPQPAITVTIVDPRVYIEQKRAEYCSQWSSLEPHPLCQGESLTLPSVANAIERMKASYMLQCLDCTFSDTSKIVAIASYTIRALDYLARSGLDTTGFPLVVDYSGPGYDQQIEALDTLMKTAAEEGVPTTLVAGPNVMEMAEAAALGPNLVIGVGTQSGMAVLPARELYHGVPLENYGPMDNDHGIGALFDMGVERIPQGTEFDQVIWQHPRPDTITYLCPYLLKVMKPGGSLVLVPDQDHANSLSGPLRDTPGFVITTNQIVQCMDAAQGLLAFSADEEIAPDVLRGLTGYNASKQWTGTDFSVHALPDTALLKIIIVRRAE